MAAPFPVVDRRNLTRKARRINAEVKWRLYYHSRAESVNLLASATALVQRIEADLGMMGHSQTFEACRQALIQPIADCVAEVHRSLRERHVGRRADGTLVWMPSLRDTIESAEEQRTRYGYWRTKRYNLLCDLMQDISFFSRT